MHCLNKAYPEPVSCTLPNGLRIVHLPHASEVVYCGYAINVGTRDELPQEAGMAHFVEHLLFKGTTRRRAWHILNRMECVGGELNASTNKEDTIVHCTCLRKDFARAADLLTDIVFHSTFPAHEIERERGVILDEIQSYQDNPSELIFDDFEEQIFQGHPLGRNILGHANDLERYSTTDFIAFTQRHYQPSNMVFFLMGNISMTRIQKLLTKYTDSLPVATPAAFPPQPTRTICINHSPTHIVNHKQTNQAHVILGALATDELHLPESRMPLALLSDLLGGSGMNSRLNVALRERRGLVYSVDSSISTYTDALLFAIYFGTDPGRVDTCKQLVYRELQKIVREPLSTSALSSFKRQAIGQLIIAETETNENAAIALGRSLLHHRPYNTLPRIIQLIEAVTTHDIQRVASQLLNTNSLSSLCYT